jgi:acyl carrier protein
VVSDPEDQIRRFISEEILFQSAEERAQLDPDYELLASIDSLGLMQLVTFLEDELGIQLEQDELREENFRTLGDVDRLVSRKAGG